MIQNTSKQVSQKSKMKSHPCKTLRMDFQLCVKKLGFNDLQCKAYLNRYETCIKKNQNI